MDTSPNITLGQAFAHCFSTSSYWWGLGIVLLILTIGWIILAKMGEKHPMNTPKIIWAVVTVFAIGIAVFGRPTMVCQNTSVEMAKKNHWLGY